MLFALVDWSPYREGRIAVSNGDALRKLPGVVDLVSVPALAGSLAWFGSAAGGVAMGPKPRSYEVRLPRSARRSALRSALSDRVNTDSLVILDAFAFMEGRIDPPSSAHRLTVAEMAAQAGTGALPNQ